MNNRRTLNEDGSAWVLFRPTNYPFKLRKQMRDANNDEDALQIMLPYILGVNLPTLSGGTVNKLATMDDLADVDEQIITQILIEFYKFRGERNLEVVPKNSSPPSTDT